MGDKGFVNLNLHGACGAVMGPGLPQSRCRSSRSDPAIAAIKELSQSSVVLVAGPDHDRVASRGIWERGLGAQVGFVHLFNTSLEGV